MAGSYPTYAGGAQLPNTPERPTPRVCEQHTITLLETVPAHDRGEIIKLIQKIKLIIQESDPTTHEAVQHLNFIVPDYELPITSGQRHSRQNSHAQIDPNSPRDPARDSTRSNSIFIDTHARDQQATRFTPSTGSDDGSAEDEIPKSRKRPLEPPINDSPGGVMMSFDREMKEIKPRTMKPRTDAQQNHTNQIRKRGACHTCRSKKQQCNLDHTPEKAVPKTRKRRSPQRPLDVLPSRTAQGIQFSLAKLLYDKTRSKEKFLWMNSPMVSLYP
ncbi:hypothetical protein AOQ84DRAFT_182079 [Glonium stellatum]|uniref:Uncharacterized protein n=1 Tax=Glonium stellatum TaxID=574774 RepID=A0A8E2F717_9PEZI|nr:hypothetical protein AOQ84DRAFT_182079 [Glonium stellatum]